MKIPIPPYSVEALPPLILSLQLRARVLGPVVGRVRAHGGGPFGGEEGGLRCVGLRLAFSASVGAVGDFGRVCCALADGGCEGGGSKEGEEGEG